MRVRRIEQKKVRPALPEAITLRAFTLRAFGGGPMSLGNRFRPRRGRLTVAQHFSAGETYPINQKLAFGATGFSGSSQRTVISLGFLVLVPMLGSFQASRDYCHGSRRTNFTDWTQAVSVFPRRLYFGD